MVTVRWSSDEIVFRQADPAEIFDLLRSGAELAIVEVLPRH